MSTSFQTRQLSSALEKWFELERLELPSWRNRWLNKAARLARNWTTNYLSRPKADFVLYANDGLIDLRRFSKAKRLLYWYDAPDDWRLRPPQRRWSDYNLWLRYQNVLHADYVFAVSAIQLEIARELRRGREETVAYMPVGVDCNAFDPSRFDGTKERIRLGIPTDAIVVGYLGYIGILGGRYAGLPLVEAARELACDERIHFLVVGFGPGLSVFRSEVAKLGLSERFTFTGFVEDHEVPLALAAMDIAVDTLDVGFHSLARSETKLKQYMAMGKTCVATAIGENVVDLDNGRCGILVEPTSESLAAGVKRAAADEKLRVELGMLVRRRAVEHYEWKRLAEKMAIKVQESVGR